MAADADVLGDSQEKEIVEHEDRNSLSGAEEADPAVVPAQQETQEA